MTKMILLVFLLRHRLQSVYMNPLNVHCCHMVYSYKACPCPLQNLAKPSFVIFDIRALWCSGLSITVPGCQKITNDGLTRSGTGCFVAVYSYGNSGRQRVKRYSFFSVRSYTVRIQGKTRSIGQVCGSAAGGGGNSSGEYAGRSNRDLAR